MWNKTLLISVFIGLNTMANAKDVIKDDIKDVIKDVIIESPNHNVKVEYASTGCFHVTYHPNKNKSVHVVQIPLYGFVYNTNNANQPQLESVSKAQKVHDDYTMLTGKRSHCTNRGTQRTFHFTDTDNRQMDLVFRVYNDGIAFRYVYPKNDSCTIYGEKTQFSLPTGINRWTQKLEGSYEDFYEWNSNGVGNNQSRNWGFPALFEVSDSVFALITEADISRGNCGSWLNNQSNNNIYQVQMAENQTVCHKGWTSPWRLVMVGKLADIVESTLVTDVSKPSKIKDTSWIKPGMASWIYWAYNRGSKDFPTVKKYIDFATALKLPYVLIDWEWDVMTNGGDIYDAINLAKQRNVSTMLWYNSSTAWCSPEAGPLYRLNSPENREKEFRWLDSLGVKGIKVDFFKQDYQATMNYFIDILEDAARHHLMVNFHGATIPRGLQRTYPNMMSVEGVYGAEWYNNAPTLTNKAASHNCTLPFTRNVVGPMDYTPCTFTDSQHPHITSNGHELALLVAFESALQHLADRPAGYYAQPSSVQQFISHLPTAWDDVHLLNGYPASHVVIARRKGNTWYIAGLNGTDQPRTLSVNLDFMKKKAKSICLYADGAERNTFNITAPSASNETFNIPTLPRGGFVMTVQM